ncbi:MAG: hypothetical protein IPJ84_06220 [Bdellovibrionales bacterium]|nr:hypothetical protein [Bdellovibrionales bacterium]
MLFRSDRSSHLFAVFCLVATSWTVIATSSSGGSLYGTYRAQSDCVSPVVDLTISVVESTVTSPVSFTFLNLGLPTSTLNIGQPVTGIVNGVNRVCEIAFTSGYGVGDNYLYTCSDNGQFACNVYLDSL